MIKKIWKYLFLLIISQLAFFIIPMFVYNKIIIAFTLLINAFVSWYIIKNVEKLYYKRYQTFHSLLYMICPLIGEIVVFGVLYIIFKLPSVFFLLKYYLVLYILVYIINIIYVIINRNEKMRKN